MVEQRRIPESRMTGPVGPGTAAVAALTPKEIVAILRRHVWLIIALTILGFIIGGLSWFLLMRYYPRYTSQAYLRILPPVEKDPMTIVSAQVQKEIQYGYRVSMANLITQQSTLQELIDRDKVQQTKWFQGFGKIRDKQIREAVEDLRDYFGAFAHRDADYVVLSMTCCDSVEAALIVNEMIDLFIESQGGTKRAEVAARLARLTDQQNSLQRDLDSSERALADVRERWNLTDLEETAGRQFDHTITLKLNDLEMEQNSLVLELSQTQAAIGTLQQLATGPLTEQVEHEIENDPIMVNLANQLALQESALAATLTKFGENHKVVREIRELISSIREERALRKAEIAEQTRQANLLNAQDRLVVLQQRYEELEKRRQEAEAKKKDLDLARIQYQQRLAIRDERRNTLDSVKTQIEKLKIMHDDPETPKVQRVGYAPVPLEVSSPKWKLYFPGGTMLGFMAGIGLAFLIELLNDLVRTPRDVSRYLHIPLLGIIPDADEDEQAEDVDRRLIVRLAPYSITSESYRRLCTNLELFGSADLAKTILVTSGAADDGKTSVAVNLATMFVHEDKKILLVDANFWRPNLHNVFPRTQAETGQAGDSEFGLTTLLAGLCGYKEIIRPSGIEGLDIIDSGPLPSNPAELLGGAQMRQLLKQLRESYDYIVVDGPPVLVVSATKILARLVDGTILVFNAAFTTRGAAQRTIREMREVNAVTFGCVLMAVKSLKGGYFREQFRSFQEYQKLQLARSI
jgi:capsular exopolysaccharide synthesis family protein